MAGTWYGAPCGSDCCGYTPCDCTSSKVVLSGFTDDLVGGLAADINSVTGYTDSSLTLDGSCCDALVGSNLLASSYIQFDSGLFFCNSLGLGTLVDFEWEICPGAGSNYTVTLYVILRWYVSHLGSSLPYYEIWTYEDTAATLGATCADFSSSLTLKSGSQPIYVTNKVTKTGTPPYGTPIGSPCFGYIVNGSSATAVITLA